MNSGVKENSAGGKSEVICILLRNGDYLQTGLILLRIYWEWKMNCDPILRKIKITKVKYEKHKEIIHNLL